jgi:hypothetical protein
MQPEIRVNVPQFWEQGYLLIRNVFSGDEIEEFRRHALERSRRSGDLLSHPELRKVLLDQRVLGVASQILGGTPVYYGDSTANLGQHSFGFHKDNADRDDINAPDWKSRYSQIRFGVYLQDHSCHSGGLRVIPGSHNAVMNPGLKPKNVRSRSGDLVVWNLRTDHAGAAIMLKLLPWLYIERGETWGREPRILLPITRPFRMKIPRQLLASEGPERAALFFSLGLDDAHLERYLNYLKTRAYMVESWKNTEYGADVWEAVKGKNIKVLDMGEEIRRQLAAGDTSLGASKGYVAIPY